MLHCKFSARPFIKMQTNGLVQKGEDTFRMHNSPPLLAQPIQVLLFRAFQMHLIHSPTRRQSELHARQRYPPHGLHLHPIPFRAAPRRHTTR